MNSEPADKAPIIAAIENWVAEVVVRHRFCPFAQPALNKDWVSYSVIDAVEPDEVLQQFASRVSALQESGQPDATELLILSQAATSFDDFLDLAALAEALIESMGWQEFIQLATFHPDYQFADTSPHSMENYTNRAPWPVIQLLQVASVGRAIDQFGDTTEIPKRNLAHLNAMDDASADALMLNSCPPVLSPGVSKH